MEDTKEKRFVGLDGLKRFWTKAKTWIAGQITAEVTAKIAELVANAPEDLDTLKEISDWITEHANSAAEMNTQIIKNQDDIKLLQNKTVESCPVDVVESGNMHAVTSNAVAEVLSNHNGIFRGKCLNGNKATLYPTLPIGNTKYLPGGGYTIEQVLANIAAGKFDDVYIGDYFIDSENKVYRIAGLDTELNKGDTPLTSHHAVIVTDFALTYMNWNTTDTTEGGYNSSDVQAYCDGAGQAAIESVFGAAHVLTVRDILSSGINASAVSPGYSGWSGAASAFGWFSHKVRLMSEVEVYGTRVWSGGHDIGTANKQFPLFQLMPQFAAGLHYDYWLSGIASVNSACDVDHNGVAYKLSTSSYALGVRVRFLVG